jgi:hypothetical protein
MTRQLRLVILGLALLAAGALYQPIQTLAQSVIATRTQPDSQHLDAATIGCTATGAGNTTVTCTLGPPPAGQFVYVSNCTVHEVANAAITGAAAPAGLLTTTNLSTNLIWWTDNATQGTGWQKEVMKEQWANGLKTAQPGTSFTIAQTGGQSTQTVRINCVGWVGY